MLLEIPLVTPDFGLIVWQTVTFLLVLLILSRYAWKPIMNGLKDREQSIEKALSEAETARNEIKNLQAKNMELLDEARQEKDKMIKTATQLAVEIREEAHKKAEVEYHKMLDEARRVIETEKMKAVSAIKDQITLMSIEIAEKLLRKQLDNPEAQKQLAEGLVKDLKLN
jgi:F-type H+-transporting ATPase subunit b